MVDTRELDSIITRHYSEMKAAARSLNWQLRLTKNMIKAGDKLFPQLTSLALKKIFFSISSYRPDKKDLFILEKLSQRRTVYLESGKAVSSYLWGNGGARVLLVHGWNSSALRFSVLIDALLQDGYQVVAFDAPGHGDSPTKSTDMNEFIESMFLLEKHYGEFHAVVGHSFGALSVCNAVKRQLNPGRVVLINTPSQFIGLVNKYARIIGLPQRQQDNLCSRVEQHFDKGPEIWEEYSAYAGLETVGIPAHVFHDRDDKEVSSIEGYCLSQAWPGAIYTETRGLGHNRILRDQATIRKILQFLAG